MRTLSVPDCTLKNIKMSMETRDGKEIVASKSDEEKKHMILLAMDFSKTLSKKFLLDLRKWKG